MSVMSAGVGLPRSVGSTVLIVLVEVRRNDLELDLSEMRHNASQRFLSRDFV